MDIRVDQKGNDMAPIAAEVLRDLRDAYGDLGAPDFNFVQKRHDRCRDATVMANLSEFFEIVNSTDLNDDVALTLFLKQGRESYGLRLSLVGRYAAVSDEQGRIMDATTIGSKSLAAILVAQNYRILTRAELRTNVPFGAGGGGRSLYELLFSDDEADLL